MQSPQALTNRHGNSSAGAVDAEDAETWFRTEGAVLHPAYGEECYYNESLSRYVPLTSPQPARQLEKLILTFRTLSIQGLSPVETEFNVTDCSWNDVLNQLDQARDAHNKADKRKRRKMDKFFANAAPYTEKLMEAVPDEYGLKVLKGGLALVFSSAKQKVENRHKIVAAFEDLPEIIRTVDVACKVLKGGEEENLAEFAKSFYDQLFKDIPDLINILHGKVTTGKKFWNRVALGIPETQRVDAILERVKRASTSASSRIERLRMKLEAKSHQDIEAINATLVATYEGVGRIYNKIQNFPKALDELAMFRHELQAGYQLIHQQQKEILQQQRSVADDAAEAKTSFLALYRELQGLREAYSQLQLLCSQNQSLQLENRHSRQPSPIPPPSLSPVELLHTLNVRPACIMNDLNFVLKQGNRASSDSQGRARWLFKTQSFQRWLSTPQSSLLLVDGSMGLEKTSPLSVLIGTLAISQLEMNSAVTIHFFCGEHLDCDASDGLSGPIGMLRSLITQLVLSLTTPLPNLLHAIDSPQLLSDIRAHTLPALCELFRLLVEQIPLGLTLFCLLDGIAWYEQDQWLEGLRYTVGMLKDVVAQGPTPHLARPVKVLLTSPNRSIRIRDIVDHDSQYLCLAPGFTSNTSLTQE